MKLWIKISLLCGTVMLLALGGFWAVLVYETWQNNQNKVIESSTEQLLAAAGSITREIGNTSLSRYSDVARRSFLRYAVRRSAGGDYILLLDGEEILNDTAYEILDGNGDRWQGEEPEYAVQATDGMHILVAGMRLTGLDDADCRLILVRDISEVYTEVRSQALFFGAAVLLTIFFAADLIFWLVKHQLKPLAELERTALEISGGNLSRRMRVRTRDEVGHVGDVFNRMAEQVEEQMRELQEVSESRRLLLGSLTHELRTPMTSIIGYSDTLMNVRLTEQQQKRALSHINAECHRLERLSGKMMSLLGLYDNEAVTLEPFSMKELFSRVEKLEKYRLKERGMTLAMDCRMGVMRMDVDLMESLLVNLIDNAVKASPDGGRIELTAAERALCVRDYGKGIPAEELPRVTEAFYMVDKSRSKKAGGIGLGLALCERIARLHGGRLKIESRPGEGTSVYVFFDDKEAV